MPAMRPQSAPVRPGERPDPVERLIDLKDLLKDEYHPHIADWWCKLPITGRARGRWVFIEPDGLGYPRQRARREILDLPGGRLDDLDLPEESMVERHNKSQHFKPVKGVALTMWKEFCLTSTNKEFQKVPEPDFSFGPKVWMRAFRKSHGGLLRPGALEFIEKWQPGSTQRQRSAISELLWSFTDHMTARRGVTETKIQYGPKQGEQAVINLIDPFASNLGRPSSAPIAHAVQRKFEAQKRDKENTMLEKGKALRAARLAAPPKQAFEKRDIDTLSSTVPIKWATGAGIKLSTTNSDQMNTVKPKDLADAIKWGVPGYACRPPATSGMGRHLGKPEWHGDAMYGRYWPAATKTFQPLDQQRRPWHIPGHDRLKRDLA